MATIRSKIIINVVVILLTIVGICSMNYFNLKEMAHMQNIEAKRSQDTVDAKEASMGGMALYQIIADAEIERDLDTAAKKWAEKKAEVLKNMDIVLTAADTPEEKKSVEDIKATVQVIANLFESQMLPALKASDLMTAEIKDLDHKIDGEIDKIEMGMDKVAAALQKKMKASEQEFDADVNSIIIQGVIIGLIGILLQAGLATWLMQTIMKPLDSLRLMLMDISQGDGDLTKRLDETTKDELADVSRYFNLFIEKLRTMVIQIANTSGQVASAASQLNASSEQIATGSEEVAAQAATVATAGEEMSATSADIAQNCQMAAEGAQRASHTASNGAEVVEKTVSIMAQIAVKAQKSAKTVESLGARSDQIGAIIGTIEDIADQTNLLALNAAIESARAGEQGRGFAVVADEVRTLAERTTRATHEIGKMIKTIQQETREAVAAMEQEILQVETGTKEAAKSGHALQEILQQVNEVSLQIQQVATAAEEQTATTSEISINMHQITEVIQLTSQGAHESATAATQLHCNAEELQRLVNQFKL